MGTIVAILGRLTERLRRTAQAKGPQRPRQNAGMIGPKASTTGSGSAPGNDSSSLSGAAGRAGLVAFVVMLPAILVPHLAPENGQVLLLIAVFAAVVVLAEYASAYPALIEFRFAAPFNRMRFVLLALTVAALSLLQRGAVVEAPLPDLIAQFATACAALVDLPMSPVRLLVAALPTDLALAEALRIRDGAAMAMVLGLATLAGFATAIRLNLWPMGQGPFNVWINLPTFDPTGGSDVVARLQRHARLNVSLGLLMPFLTPGVVMASDLMVHAIDFTAPLNFVWGIALWAFVPTALVMRGLAMARVARMIRANRRRLADGDGAGFAPA